eukprot:jgi/Chlat1/1671/Chrsp127S01911
MTRFGVEVLQCRVGILMEEEAISVKATCEAGIAPVRAGLATMPEQVPPPAKRLRMLVPRPPQPRFTYRLPSEVYRVPPSAPLVNYATYVLQMLSQNNPPAAASASTVRSAQPASKPARKRAKAAEVQAAAVPTSTAPALATPNAAPAAAVVGTIPMQPQSGTVTGGDRMVPAAERLIPASQPPAIAASTVHSAQPVSKPARKRGKAGKLQDAAASISSAPVLATPDAAASNAAVVGTTPTHAQSSTGNVGICMVSAAERVTADSSQTRLALLAFAAGEELTLRASAAVTATAATATAAQALMETIKSSTASAVIPHACSHLPEATLPTGDTLGLQPVSLPAADAQTELVTSSSTGNETVWHLLPAELVQHVCERLIAFIDSEPLYSIVHAVQELLVLSRFWPAVRQQSFPVWQKLASICPVPQQLSAELLERLRTENAKAFDINVLQACAMRLGLTAFKGRNKEQLLASIRASLLPLDSPVPWAVACEVIRLKVERINVTTARNRFRLTDLHLAGLPFLAKSNPHGRRCAPMRLYLLHQVQRVALRKHGNSSGLLAAQRRSDKAAEKRRASVHRNQQEREELLVTRMLTAAAPGQLDATRAKELVRLRSRPCRRFVLSGIGEADEIVDAVLEMDWLCSSTHLRSEITAAVLSDHSSARRPAFGRRRRARWMAGLDRGSGDDSSGYESDNYADYEALRNARCYFDREDVSPQLRERVFREAVFARWGVNMADALANTPRTMHYRIKALYAARQPPSASHSYWKAR